MEQQLKLILKLSAAAIRVSLDLIRLCPTEIGTLTTTKTSLNETGTPGVDSGGDCPKGTKCYQ